MKQGFKVLDADLQVIEPHDLYLKYMDPKWGNRIPRAEPRALKAGDIHDFKTADGGPVRKPWREAPPKDARVVSSLREEVQLSLKPSEYFHRQCFIHIDVDEYPAADVIRGLGADNFFSSTDYPHADSRFPHATETFLALEGRDAATKRKILWDNPARMYNL